jgi:hypothetical protein
MSLMMFKMIDLQRFTWSLILLIGSEYSTGLKAVLTLHLVNSTELSLQGESAS